jgi:hypothetical protein
MQGAVAQLGEHLLCKQGVNGSIPFSSTTLKKVIGTTRANLLEVQHPAWREILNLAHVASVPQGM